jgi:hypothetical protein
MANCQNPNCLTLGVHRKTCQAFRLRYESFVPDSTRLPPQYPQRYLAGFSAGLGILIIGGKKRRSPQFQNVRPPANGGLFFCWRQTGAAKLRQPADLALRPDLPLAGCPPVSCLLVTRTNAAFMRTRDAFIRTNPSFKRTNVSTTRTTQLTRLNHQAPSHARMHHSCAPMIHSCASSN